MPFPSCCLICAIPIAARKALSDQKRVKVRIEHRRAIAILIKNWAVVIRSALIGMFTGILPGAGGSIANILAYDQAKKAAKDDSQFGKGDPRGIIAPETSNNAVEGGALTPLMALGIPGDITAAIMLGALLMHDIVPGPTFISDEPALSYSIFIAFFLASFIMLGMQSGVSAGLCSGDTGQNLYSGDRHFGLCNHRRICPS